VTEFIIFPLGSKMVHEQIPCNVRSYLFYGPQGTGKTLVVRACVHETNSIFFDLSPINIDEKYTDSKENEKLVASVMMVADEYQPSIIYIDECHKVFPGKKKKGKKKKGGKKKKKQDSSDPKRIKKAIKKWKDKFMNEKRRITIIGCTSEPENGSMKDFKKMFDKAIYFPFPDYTTRRLMWKTFIERCEGELRQDFPLSTLALISAGYSSGSILETCQKVLTKFRRANQKQRPLNLNEFIGPLSLRNNTMDDEYASYCDFTDKVTGDDKIRKKMEKGDGPDDGKKKKKGKKGKKKK
jgi:SpoVK/Ycf46/Vps4 family AAA+-type ATPase